MPLREHILHTMDQIAGHATAHGASGALHLLRNETQAGQNDARWLRERQREEQLLAEVSRQAAQRFAARIDSPERLAASTGLGRAHCKPVADRKALQPIHRTIRPHG